MAITENLEKEILISGTGKEYHFDREIYLNVIKFMMTKFNIPFDFAKGVLNYFLVTDVIKKDGQFVHIANTDKRATNARLKNIVELDYKWDELFRK